MKINKLKNPVSGNFHLCFHGFNLSGALLALAALQSGLKVDIIIDQPLKWDFEPEITTLYPLRFRNMFHSLRSIRYLEKISSLFPTLIYPQRILVVSEERKFRAKAISLIDYVLKRDREIASLPMNFSMFPSYQILENHFQNGLLVQEFRFDRNMAIIKMLHKCKEMGANIVRRESTIPLNSDDKSRFLCLPFQHKHREMKIENFQLNFQNNVQIVAREFEMTSHVRESSTFFHFQILRYTNQQLMLDKVFYLLKAIGIESPEKFQKKLISIFKDTEWKISQREGELNLLSDPEISSFEKNLNSERREISKAIGKRIRFKKMIKALNYNKFDGFNFRKLQAECEEKFDLAKQTGIDYKKFSYFFYRYYDHIDDLIELAYQKINSHRSDPQRLWETVEQEFKVKIEAELFS
jgi:hypothetical protein